MRISQNHRPSTLGQRGRFKAHAAPICSPAPFPPSPPQNPQPWPAGHSLAAQQLQQQQRPPQVKQPGPTQGSASLGGCAHVHVQGHAPRAQVGSTTSPQPSPPLPLPLAPPAHTHPNPPTRCHAIGHDPIVAWRLQSRGAGGSALTQPWLSWPSRDGGHPVGSSGPPAAVAGSQA